MIYQLLPLKLYASNFLVCIKVVIYKLYIFIDEKGALMRARKTISLILLFLIIGISGGILYTNSKYVSSKTGAISAEVAKYVFDVSGKDSFNESHTIDNLVLADTCNSSSLVNGKIAPGTSGSFDIVVDASGSDVSINYFVSFTNNSGHNLPTNLKFKLDGVDWSFDDGISNTIFVNSDSQIVTHKITWQWAYETEDSENNITAGDLADTTDGLNGFDYSFTVTAIGTQLNPAL